MTYPIPPAVYAYLKQSPTTSGAEIQRLFGVSGRSARRYREMFSKGVAVPKNAPPLTVTSKAYQEYEADQDGFSPHEWLRNMHEMAKAATRIDPIITQDVLTVDTDRPIAFSPISCLHLGGRYTAYQEFEQVYDWMLGRDRLIFGSLGDDPEGFGAQFPDADARIQQLLPVPQQIDVLKVILDPLVSQGKLVFGCGSQHGGKWSLSKEGHNPIKQMYLDYGVPFYDGPAYVKLVVGAEEYFIALAHEFPGSSAMNPNHPQARALRFRYPMADVVMMGDKHTGSVQHIPAYVDEYDAGNRKSPYCLLVQVGTAKTGPDRYTVTGGWSRGMFDWPVLIFYPDKHRVEWYNYRDTVDRVLDAK